MTIDQISMQHFKCFPSLHLRTQSLTVFTGFNAAGKSTALQSLLLLAQGLRTSPLSHYLPLNGPLVRLGSAGDVIRRERRGPIEFAVEGFETNLRWKLAASKMGGFGEDDAEGEDWDADDNERQRLAVLSVEVNGRLESSLRLRPRAREAGALRKTIRNVIFLGATRAAQHDIYPWPDEAVPIRGDVGNAGQFAPWWYDRTADNTVLPERRRPDDPSVTVRSQVDAWLDYLFPGAAANVEAVRGTGQTRLLLKASRKDDWSRPVHIGFGVGYVFPMIVALLSARHGQVVVIDSPEAHLHPRAQSRMGQMLALFAAAGVQVFIETHSDHVLSGIRLGVRRRVIHADQVAIHFFSGRTSELETGIISPTIDVGGHLSAWPTGFFDQIDADLEALAEPQ